MRCGCCPALKQCRGYVGKVAFHPPHHIDRLHDFKPWASCAYICI